MLSSVCKSFRQKKAGMAQEEKRPSSTQPKRLARAKIKRPETPLTEEERKAERKKKLRNIVVAAFAVILAIGMMVPSLTYIVGGMRQSKANSEARELANALSEGEEVSSEQVDALYAEAASSYEATLESQPDDTEALQQLGNLYLTWGSAVNYYATDEGASDHAAELYAKAQGVYDRYLAIEDSSDVRVNRALCSLYSGQISDAQTQLEAIVADDPECSSAWANLGMVYDWFDPEAALAAYQQAVSTDPDGQYSSTAYAQSRIEALTATDEEAAEGEEAADAGATEDESAVDAGAAGQQADGESDDSEAGTSN